MSANCKNIFVFLEIGILPFFAQQTHETSNQTIGESGLGDQSDTGGFEWAKGNISDELAKTG